MRASSAACKPAAGCSQAPSRPCSGRRRVPWTRTRSASSCIAQSTATGSRRGASPMRSTNRQTGRALGAALLAAACAFAGNVFAGGALYLVPSGGTLKPAHWDVTNPVKVYLDKGPLNIGSGCVLDPETYECVLNGNGNPVVPVLDEKAGDDLVASTVYQWSHVPTSNF